MNIFYNNVKVLFIQIYKNLLNYYTWEGDKNENLNTYNNIICKIRKYIPLNLNDLEFVKTLSKKQLISIIKINNVYTESMNEYVSYDIEKDKIDNYIIED